MDTCMHGLKTTEAEELEKQGQTNRLPKSKEGGVLDIVFRNTFTLFNLLNAALALVLFLIGSYRNMLFMGVVLSNILIGTIQEIRAKRTHDRLSLLSEGKITTLRDGEPILLSPSQLVLGDVVMLSRGDQVPADGMVLEGSAHLDESNLTGESEPITKNPGDTILSGSFLSDGKVCVRLTAVGVNSYMGKLQMSARKVKKARSELLRDMNRIIRWVSAAVVPLGLLLYFKQTEILGLVRNEAIVRSIASVIGMIPEGLILLTSVSLAAGVVALGKRKTLVNQLYGIESLARTDVLCMDKTGTLTSGKMTLEETVLQPGVSVERVEEALGAFFEALGAQDATSAAISAKYPPKQGATVKKWVAFSSNNKWSMASFENMGTIIMGAPEKLLNMQDMQQVMPLAESGLRVLALMQADECPEEEELPQNRVLLALLCLRDELRQKVKETVQYFCDEGVRLKVISGDNPATVSRIAGCAGIPEAEKYVDLSALPQKDYDDLAEKHTVFGRVSPEDKRQLILALQRAGHSVAMVGDGVNDIPALKTADCSLAMTGGSEAACRVAQMTLLSGGFDAMPAILLEGRRVINNITRASALFLVKNIFSMLLSLALIFLPYAYPFQPIQLTLVSSLTIGLPSFVLALQPSREKAQGNFLANIFRKALPGGICVAVLLLATMIAGNNLSLSPDVIATICTVLAGASCYMTLYLTAKPLNSLRIALLLVVAALLAVCVVCFKPLFVLTPLAGVALWLTVGLGVIALPVQRLIDAAIDWVTKRKKQAQLSA